MLERRHCDTGLESTEREGCRVQTRHGVEWTSQVSQNSDWDMHMAPYNTSFNFSFNLRHAKGPWLHSHWTLRIVAGIRLRQERAKGSWESSLGQLDKMGVSKNRGTPKWMVYIWFIMENPTKNGWFCGEKPMGLTFPRLQDAGYRASWEDAGVVGKAVYASGTQIRCLTWKVLHKKFDMKWKDEKVWKGMCIDVHSLPWCPINFDLSFPLGCWPDIKRMVGLQVGSTLWNLATCVGPVWVLNNLRLCHGRNHVGGFFGALHKVPLADKRYNIALACVFGSDLPHWLEKAPHFYHEACRKLDNRS